MNKIIIIVTVLSLLILVLVPSMIKISNEHNENLLKVTEKRIIEAGIKCFKEDICINEKITLKELYDNKYLEKESDPLTKEYYNENSYVIKKEDTYEFISLN